MCSISGPSSPQFFLVFCALASRALPLGLIVMVRRCGCSSYVSFFCSSYPSSFSCYRPADAHGDGRTQPRVNGSMAATQMNIARPSSGQWPTTSEASIQSFICTQPMTDADPMRECLRLRWPRRWKPRCTLGMPSCWQLLGMT